MGKNSRLALLMGAFFFLASCYVSSVNPLPKESAVDSSLLGLWESVPEKEVQASDKGYVLFMEDQNGMLDIAMFDENFKFTEHYRGFCSVIHGQKFINLKAVKALPDGIHVQAGEDYYTVHYQADSPDEIAIRMLNEEYFQDAILNRRVDGRKAANNYEPVVLTASADHLLQFFIKNQTNPQFYRQGSLRIRRVDRWQR